jgi:hypothetical protein
MVALDHGFEINHQLLDAAWQVRHRSILLLCFRGLYAVIFVISIPEELSFNRLPGGEIPFVVGGKKFDFPKQDWCVIQSGAREWANLHKPPLIFTSASPANAFNFFPTTLFPVSWSHPSSLRTNC